MISFLKGKPEYMGDRFAIISAGAIGYKVTMVPKLINSISKSQDEVKDGEGQTVKLFLHSQMNMREGTFDLYGFDKKEDLDLFHMLLSVSGIGPKNAMNVMAQVEPQDLKASVIHGDADYLKKVSGLGSKTAHRLVLELKNKIEFIDIAGSSTSATGLGIRAQALEALLALGYSQTQAKVALQEVADKTTNLQDQVREALKLLGRK